MRRVAFACSIALVFGLAPTAFAETVAVTELVKLRAKSAMNVRLVCPEGFEISGDAQLSTSRVPAGFERSEVHFIDGKGGVALLEDAAGVEMTLRNALDEDADASLAMSCAKRESPPVIASATLNPIGSAVLFGPCPPGKAPSGAVDHRRRDRRQDELQALQVRDQISRRNARRQFTPVPPPRSSSSPPTRSSTCRRCGWRRAASTRGPRDDRAVRVHDRGRRLHACSCPIPDGYEFVGTTTAPGATSVFTLTHVWLADGTVSTLPPFGEQGGHPGRVKGLFFDGVDTRPPRQGERQGVRRRARAPRLSLRCRALRRPRRRVLQRGTRPLLHHGELEARSATSTAACTRAGRARASRSRLCGRQHGQYGPAPGVPRVRQSGRGLDSHFYSASPQECVATLTKFKDAWLLEASEVFEMELPDAPAAHARRAACRSIACGTTAPTRTIATRRASRTAMRWSRRATSRKATGRSRSRSAPCRSAYCFSGRWPLAHEHVHLDVVPAPAAPLP